MNIGAFDTSKNVLIVAEIGNNHEGQYSLAEDLIGLAKNAGVDAVKFQTFKTDEFVSPTDTERYARLKSFEFTPKQFERLAKYAHKLGLLFISTPLDISSARFLDTIVDAYKIASGDNDFIPLIDVVASTGKPVILSAGLVDLKHLRWVKDHVYKQWHKYSIKQELAIIHCVSSYPVTVDQANLGAIPYLKDQLKITIGYSDHTLGIDAAVISTALGARIIEKHFTIRNNYSSFRDHALSANPQDMKVMVQKIRQTELLLGNRAKNIQDCEKTNLSLIRRSIVAKHDLKKGHCLSINDFSWLRPGTGIRAGHEQLLLGKLLLRGVGKGEQFALNMVVQKPKK